MSSTTGEADKLSSLTSAQSCHHFSLAEIQSATNDFDDELVIGKGGFGKVYKGRICVEETNLLVAIKRLNSMSDQGAPEFRTEIEILSKLRHRHLVSLIGFCHDNKEMILVYEYMPHGTLYHHLHKADTPLSWVQRLKIALGAGRGLDYLHTGVGVIHRDVKSSNILLDENLEARISDFGLSKVGPTNQSSSYVDASVKGTFGYLDPEYFRTGKLTRKTDVFAFGVLLFELLSGRRAVDERFGEEQCSLVRWAQKCVKDRKLDQMVDSSIRGMILPKCLRRFAQIADRCLYSVPKERPTMTEVVASLQVSLELQRKNDDSGESSGTMGFTWKIHEYFVPLTKQHSDNVRIMRARMRQLDGTSIDVMNHKDRNDMNALEVPAHVPSWLEEVKTIKSQVESISSNDNQRYNMRVRHQVGRDALKTTLEIERLLKVGLKIRCSAQKPLARFDYLKDDQEAKEIFLLCGLFPKDSDILIEDLTRYAWGLQLLNGVSTLEDARNRTEACVSHLKNAHLLIDNDDPRYVKLHDLVLDFVLATVSKGDRASLIKHGDLSTWSPVEVSESYRRISLSCEGLPEFPEGFKSPNLSLLKLMNGDNSFQFPKDFYGNTKKLEVMAYEKFQYPLLPRLLQCSTNLRTLCLHQCSLMFDCSFIGNLVNLEVLSFSHSTLWQLPSSIGNLKKLKLLDLTGCDDLRGINDGVLENLVKLEELYMRDIEFTERNSNELAGHSRNLLALEIRCFENKGQLKNMSYENLKRFKIYMGRIYNLSIYELKLFGNSLYLVTNKDELLESRLNGLLEKTEVLFLQVDGMRDLEDIEVNSLQYSSFCNLRSLIVSECAELRYIFTLRVATALSKLEYLDISFCHSMQELIHIESSEPKRIEFPKLKFLSLHVLMNLLSLCNTINVIELPQLIDLRFRVLPVFTSIYPKKKLATSSMAINDSAWRPFLNEEFYQEDITSCSLCQYSRKIDLFRCHALSSAIPFGAAGQMQKLEELTIEYCHSLVEVFETQGINNSGCCSTNFDEGSDTTLAIPKPTNINVPQLSNLKKLVIIDCNLLQHIFTFATLESLSQLHELKIDSCMAMKVIVKEETDQEQTTRKVVVFRRLKSIALVNLPTLKGFFLGMNDFQWPLLDEVKIDACPQMTVFTRGCSEAPKLSSIHTNFGKYSLDHRGLNFPQTPCSSLDGTGGSYPTTSEGIIRWSFNSLIEIDMKRGCHDGEQIIPSNELLQLQNLERIHVYHCHSVKEVFEAGKDSGLSELPFVVKIPKLREVELDYLPNLKYIWKSNPWMVLEFPNLTKVYIHKCESLEHVFSSSMVGSLLQLEHLHILNCASMEEIVKEANFVIEDEEGDSKVNELMLVVKVPKLREVELRGLNSLMYIWKSNPWMVLEFPNLTKVTISYCRRLEHVFSISMVGSLLQLQELFIMECASMEVIVEEENVVVQEGDDAKVNNEIIMLPRLKSLQLQFLPRLKGCYLGKEAFSWPSLETLKIKGCPAIRVFTKGHSATAQLKVIDTSFWRCELQVEGEDQLNSFINTKQQEGLFDERSWR